MLRKIIRKRKAQVWIETVIYTLIGLTIIGLVLAFAKPKIEEMRDKAIIDQTIEALNSLDNTISEIIISPGNVRVIGFSLRRGKLTINPLEDKIEFVLTDSKLIYSEPDKEISKGSLSLGNLFVKTESKGNLNDIKVWLIYGNEINITYGGIESEKVLQQASTPYNIRIENRGLIGTGHNIDITS